jgi:DNA polymerase III gamma/tau subunit
MSLSHRIAMLFRAKANKALDRAEDPREILDYSYQRQLELLAQVRRGVADVTTSRRRIELQIAQLQQSAAKLQGQAQQALAAGHEDLAREALTRRAAVTSQVGDLQGQQASLQAEQDKLTAASQRLQAKVERSVPARRPSRPPTPPPTPKPASARPSPGSPRRWVTSAWPSSVRRTRPSSCRPGPARWMSCWPPARCRTPPCPAAATTCSPSWMPSPRATTWTASWPG